MKKGNIHNLNLSNNAVENIRIIRADTDYYIRGLAGVSDILIDEALGRPRDCLREIEYLSMLAELRTLVESLRERRYPARQYKRYVNQSGSNN